MALTDAVINIDGHDYQRMPDSTRAAEPLTKRLEINLSATSHRQWTELAASRGISIGEMVRRSVAAYLEDK